MTGLMPKYYLLSKVVVKDKEENQEEHSSLKGIMEKAWPVLSALQAKASIYKKSKNFTIKKALLKVLLNREQTMFNIHFVQYNQINLFKRIPFRWGG